MEIKDYSHLLDDEKKRKKFQDVQSKAKKELSQLGDFPPEFLVPGLSLGFMGLIEVFSKKIYEGKSIKEYSYFQKTRSKFKKLFSRRFKTWKKTTKKSLSIQDFFNEFIKQGMLIENWNEQTKPEHRFKTSTIELALKKYADLHVLLENVGFTPIQLEKVFKFEPKIRNSISHLGVDILKNKSIVFTDTRTKKEVKKMSKKQYEKMLKQIYLLFNAALVGFMEAFSTKQSQRAMLKMWGLEKESKKHS